MSRFLLLSSTCALTWASSLAYVPFSLHTSLDTSPRLSTSVANGPRTSCSQGMGLRMAGDGVPLAERFGRRSLISDAAKLLTLAGLGLEVDPRPASADMTLNSFKRSYFRYAGRIEQGRDLFVLGLLRAIEAEDWEKVRKYYELTSTAQEGSEKETNGLAIKTSELQRSLFSPMEVFTTAFEEKGTGPKQRKMSKAVRGVEDACNAIFAASGQDGAAPDKEAALAAWEQGRKSFNQYVKVLNKGMTSQVAKLDGIEDPATYAATPPRPSNTYQYTGKATMLENYQGKAEGK